MELQKTFLSQVLRERSTATEQAFDKPAKAGLKILKQPGELLVLARHKLRYANKNT